MLRTVFFLLTAVALAFATGAPLTFSPPSNEAFDIPASVEDIADNASDLSIADTPDNASFVDTPDNASDTETEAHFAGAAPAAPAGDAPEIEPSPGPTTTTPN